LTHTTNPTLILGIAALVASFALVHLARRWRSMRARVALPEEVSFTRVQRVMHWAIGLGCAALFVTGLPVYLAQFLVSPPVPTPLQFFYWGVQVALWRTSHIYLALLIVLLVAVHSVWDTYRVKAREQITRLSRAELGEAWRRARSFLGSSTKGVAHPATKYDFFHKAFHWTLIALGAFLLISGLLEWEAITILGVPAFVWLDRINSTFMDGFIRTGHLVAAMLFASLLALHTYFAVLPQNRPFLRAMSFGSSRGRATSLHQQGESETPQ
jgi:cytochrome b subunit of formate dehydrogenase